MRINVVKQPKLLAIVTFVAVMALIFVRLIYAPYSMEPAIGADMPLGKLLDGFLGRQSVAMHSVVLLLMFLNGVLTTHLIDKYSISMVRTPLPIVMYILMGYGIFAPFGTVSAGLASILLIISSEQMIAAFKRSYTFNNVFNASFCLGIMPLIYSPSLLLVLILPVALSLYRRTPREWIVAVAGLVLPLLLASAGWYAAGYGWGFVASSLAEAFVMPTGIGVVVALNEIGVMAYVYVGLALSILFLSMAAVIAGANKMGVRARKIYVHSICLTLLSGATFFLPSGTIVSIGLIAVPAALISTAFFIRFRGWPALAVYLLLLAMAVAMNVIPLL